MAMSAAEVAFWRVWFLNNGFPADRVVGTVARAGAYLGRGWGGSASPAELIPRFGPRRRNCPARLLAYLTSLPGAVVRRVQQ